MIRPAGWEPNWIFDKNAPVGEKSILDRAGESGSISYELHTKRPRLMPKRRRPRLEQDK